MPPLKSYDIKQRLTSGCKRYICGDAWGSILIKKQTFLLQTNPSHKYIHTCAHRDVYEGVHVCTQRPEASQRYLSLGTIYLVFRQGPSLAWNLPNRLSWLVNEPGDPPVSTSIVLGLQGCVTMSWFCCCCCSFVLVWFGLVSFLFYIGSGYWTQVLMIVWQALYKLSHLPRFMFGLHLLVLS